MTFYVCEQTWCLIRAVFSTHLLSQVPPSSSTHRSSQARGKQQEQEGKGTPPPKKGVYQTEPLCVRSRTCGECRRADREMAREEHFWKRFGGRDPLLAPLGRAGAAPGSRGGARPIPWDTAMEERSRWIIKGMVLLSKSPLL